ncbi:MAG TPA: 2-oxoacid:acceptor oxidoreductase family protein [Candidatus Gastranaerophilaceae bacterium]|nr:2-oxoacid:acceptor oxidoreductase family protein [Candidatus Gastranaerophilaceae bacterium]HPT41871.1 2-oxoacid:acceptor oxidoreductase family protein [Candidatus Gastranaerophilaceae bacterium]
MNENSIILAGFGGQGILLAGEVLATAFMLDGKNVTWFPSYGAEMRGGTVNCEVVVSEDEVSSVSKKEADFIVALNQPSFDKFLPKIKKGGWIIANSSLINEEKPRNDINYVFAPITNIANDLGEVKISNIISLGILAKVSNLTSIQSLHSALDSVLPEHRKNLLPLNLKALEMGFNFASELVKC